MTKIVSWWQYVTMHLSLCRWNYTWIEGWVSLQILSFAMQNNLGKRYLVVPLLWTISAVCESGHVFPWPSSLFMTNMKNTSIFQVNMEFASAILINNTPVCEHIFYLWAQFSRISKSLWSNHHLNQCVDKSTHHLYIEIFLEMSFMKHKNGSGVKTVPRGAPEVTADVEPFPPFFIVTCCDLSVRKL